MENLELFRRDTRENALNYEKPVDVSAMAMKAGFKYPVFISANLWEAYIDPAPQLQHENSTDRLWDVLTMMVSTIENTKNPGKCIWFTVAFQMYFDGKRSTQDVRLKSILKQGFGATPVVTVMLPDED